MKASLARLRRRIAEKGGARNLARIVWQMAATRGFSAVYVVWLRALGVRIGRGCTIRGFVRIVGDPRRVTIGDRCSIHAGVTFWTHDYGEGHGRIVLGDEVTCMWDVTFNSYASIEVGRLTAVGDGCYLQDNNHGTAPGIPVMHQPSEAAPIVMGEDVWIGARCIVLADVTIGDHTVVGAGSVVVRTLPADSVAVGVPCRVVKRRGEERRAAA